MQQRQLRLGDILDDYCPRERRLTNHAVVAMVGDEVKQTRCTTCDAEHDYKHAKVPRQRRKDEAPAALYAQVAAGAPKRVVPPQTPVGAARPVPDDAAIAGAVDEPAARGGADETVVDDAGASDVAADADEDQDDGTMRASDEGPCTGPLIRASLPRPDGQQPPARPIPEFTIRQPGGGRPNRFRPRHHRGGQGGGQGHQGHQGHQFHGNHGNRSAATSAARCARFETQRGPTRHAKRHGPPGRKRSK